MGKYKRRIYPRDVTINVGKGVQVEVPEPYRSQGQKWKEVRVIVLCLPMSSCDQFTRWVPDIDCVAIAKPLTGLLSDLANLQCKHQMADVCRVARQSHSTSDKRRCPHSCLQISQVFSVNTRWADRCRRRQTVTQHPRQQAIFIVRNYCEADKGQEAT